MTQGGKNSNISPLVTLLLIPLIIGIVLLFMEYGLFVPQSSQDGRGTDGSTITSIADAPPVTSVPIISTSASPTTILTEGSPDPAQTSIPNPTPTQFTDNFEDATDTRGKWTPVTGIWEIVEGKYYCFIGAPQKFAMTTAGSIDWRNYTLSVDVMATKGVDKIILFRYLDNINTYQINLRSEPSNDIILARGIVERPKILKRVKLGNLRNVWYRIRIVGKGNVIRVYVNDQLYIDYLDDSSPVLNGGIGLVAHSSDIDTEVYFDNVDVVIEDNP